MHAYYDFNLTKALNSQDPTDNDGEFAEKLEIAQRKQQQREALSAEDNEILIIQQIWSNANDSGSPFKVKDFDSSRGALLQAAVAEGAGMSREGRTPDRNELLDAVQTLRKALVQEHYDSVDLHDFFDEISTDIAKSLLELSLTGPTQEAIPILERIESLIRRQHEQPIRTFDGLRES